jgi:beta-lactamase class A
MGFAVVIKNVAPLKLDPRFDTETADEVLYGMVVEVLGVENKDWYLVKTHYDYEGYIHKDDVVLDAAKAEEWKNGNYIMWKLTADVLTGPSYKSSVVITLTRGAVIKHTGIIEDKWEKIGLVDGSFGWIRRGFAKQVEKLSLEREEERVRANIVQAALDYMGTQYRWGGKSPLGIDCSGLASMAYMLNGYIIPRDADQQEEYLKTIDRKDAKPGDLFFFPGHVAVCIGDGRYVHATGREGYVLMNSLNPKDEDYRADLDKDLTSTATIFGMEA